MKINFKNPQKPASHVNEEITLKVAKYEILDCKKALEHTRIGMSWVHKQSEEKRRREKIIPEQLSGGIL